ncbi:hypothetical protein [Azohydromonas australica]|uniref:hypothetical protein n=1 Tax=Azohydromonas australica TaxID=364039 RepID=UPI000416F3E6|nr:hypothetical protein [Azohydromonas australica]
MIGIDWRCAFLSLVAAATVGLVVGYAAQWTVGLVLSIGWCAVHLLVEGIKILPGVAEEVQLEVELMR